MTNQRFLFPLGTLFFSSWGTVCGLLLCNYTAGIASYLWPNELLLFFPGSLLCLSESNLGPGRDSHLCLELTSG